MQEMVVPVAVLTARDELPEGWVEPPSTCRTGGSRRWKNSCGRCRAAGGRAPSRHARRSWDALRSGRTSRGGQRATRGRSRRHRHGQSGWLDQLFDSPVLAEQKKLGGRAVPRTRSIRQMLEALAEQGGKLTSAALARRMGLPPFRLPGLLAAVQRVLNVEGYPILTRDEVSDTIELEPRTAPPAVRAVVTQESTS